MRQTVKLVVSKTKYREDAEIDRLLNLVRDLWRENNYFSLGEILHCVCKVKEVDIRHLTDLQLQNYIINYIEQGSNVRVQDTEGSQGS